MHYELWNHAYYILILILHFREAYDHLLEWVPESFGKHIVLKCEDYPNISYCFCHEYLSALAEEKITSVDNAPDYSRYHHQGAILPRYPI